jgi:ADP-ribosylglycohydrolase
MGFPTEFQSSAQIDHRFGPWRELPLPVVDGVAYITDDTQMALAVGFAVRDALDAHGTLGPGGLEPLLRERFVEWWRSPENNRAPGMTCLRACEGLSQVAAWQDATVMGSKGCGANMRVHPLGLVPGLTADQQAGAAQLQAALTHGHPTGLAASDLTAQAVRLLAAGTRPAELVGELRAYAEANSARYHAHWLGDLADRTQDPDPVSFIRRGWAETLAALARLEAALAAPDLDADPCLATGDGWIAEEALATGLYCFLLLPDDPVAAVRRAAHSSGDSDSIAALTGAFAGARHGLAAWPQDWVAAVEHRDQLLALGARWDAG